MSTTTDEVNNVLYTKIDKVLTKMQSKGKYSDLTVHTATQDADFMTFLTKLIIYESIKPSTTPALPTGTSTKAKALRSSLTSGRGRSQAERIIVHLTTFPNKTREEICDALNILNQSACGVIAKLKEEGKIFVSGTKFSSTDIEVECYSTLNRVFKR